MKKWKENRIGNRLISVVAALLLCTTPLLCAAEEIPTTDPEATQSTTGTAQGNPDSPMTTRAPYMSEVLEKLTFTKTDETVVLLPETATATGELVFQTGLHEDPRNVLVSNTDVGDITWNFALATSGWYVIRVEYTMLSDSGNEGVRGLLIDGTSPYFETESISFARRFQDDGEVRVNSIGDEVRPSVKEVTGWQSVLLYDSSGSYSTPLVFPLDAGEHTITLSHITQDMAIAQVTVEPYKPTKPYAEVLAGYPSVPKTEGLLTFQAEDSVTIKTDPTVRLESNGDPSTEPISYGYRVYNAVGGYAWRQGGQSISFDFTVPKTGLYRIALRTMQSWNDGLPSYRRISIDGEIPFTELEEVRFDYSTDWQTTVLGGNEPFYFYLEAGTTHTLTMTVTLGPIREIVQTMYDDMSVMSGAMLDITKLTGNSPDPNYDYQFFKYIPTLEGDLQSVVDNLNAQYKKINEISGKSTSMGSSMISIIRQMEAMIEKPFTIAKRYNQLEQAQTNLGSWYLELQSQPLLMDEFTLAGGDEVVPVRKASFLEKLKSTWKNFIVSFEKDYNNVGGMLDGNTEIKETINVWISRGNEWAEVIKEMSDEGFTAKTGVMVNLNVVPSSQLNTGSANVLMLSITSGTAPDVVMGMAAGSPVEFAIRDAAVDLTQFEDYEEVSKRFLPQIFTTLNYRDGIYALPETMSFTALFYRTDVLEKYNIKVPDTRQELYDTTLPQLFENGLTYYQPNDFTQFLYQYGGSFYTEDGYYSALDSVEAYRAFRELTEMYTHYSTPVAASFFNRFRTGEMPIGVGNYSLYIQLATAAPELIGKWEMAPLPGVVQENGEINRACAGTSSEVDMLIAQESDEKYDECWEFLKWWTDATVQRSFAKEIESLVGVEARWNTANVEAFLSLDWNKKDLEVIQEQWEWARETPIVLGSAYTNRHIVNAFTNVVVSGSMTVRDALEKAVKEINRELRTKQEEYGVFVDELEGGK